MTKWNKDAPDIAGLQWPASRSIDYPLPSGNAMTGHFRADVAETTDRLRIFATNDTAEAIHPIVDVYDQADMDHGLTRCYLTVPQTIASQSPGWHAWPAAGPGFNAQSGPTTNLQNYIDDFLDFDDPWTGSPGPASDWIRYLPTQAEAPGSLAGAGGQISMQMNPSLFTCADHTVGAPGGTPISGTDRVVGIELQVLLDYVNAKQEILWPTLVVPGRNPAVGEAYGKPLRFQGAGVYGLTLLTWMWTFRQNPASGEGTAGPPDGVQRPFNVADWQQLCTGGQGYFKINLAGLSQGNTMALAGDPGIPSNYQSTSYSGFHFYAVNARLYVVGEKRKFTCDFSIPPNSGSKWWYGHLKNASTDAQVTFTKVVNKTYVVAARGEEGTSGQATWRAMDCGETSGHENDFLDGFSSSSLLLDPNFPGAGVPASRAPTFDPQPAAFAMTWAQGFGNRQDGSQPYVELKPIGLWNGTHYLGQEFGTAHTPGSYGLARVLILNYGGQQGPLTVSLFRSDLAVTYASETILPSDLDPADVNWVFRDVELEPSTAVTGAEVALYASTTAQSAAGPWILGVLTAREDLQTENVTIFGDITFQDTNGRGRYVHQPPGGGPPEASGSLDYADTSFQILLRPPALTGFAAAPAAQNLPVDLAGSCAVTTVPYINLDWGTAAPPRGWRAYEIERWNPQTGQWDRIGDLTGTAGDSEFADFEIPSGVEQGYRARVRDALGVPSAWSTILPSVMITHAPWAYYLVSNVNPTRNVALQYETPEQWASVDSEGLVVRKLFGRNKQIAFRPTERRGRRWSKTLIVAAVDPAITGSPPTSISGPALFDRLLDICDDPLLPYVAVLDHYGNRWLTAPAVGDMTRTNPGEQHLAVVEFVEVATKPFPSGTVFGVLT